MVHISGEVRVRIGAEVAVAVFFGFFKNPFGSRLHLLRSLPVLFLFQLS
jgi:hypothetical protein